MNDNYLRKDNCKRGLLAERKVLTTAGDSPGISRVAMAQFRPGPGRRASQHGLAP